MAYQVFLSDNINVAELDTESVDINSVFSITDLEDITNRNADIKQIQFKGTKNNDYVFGSFFDFSRSTDMDNSNRLFYNYNPLRPVLCLVYSDSTLIFKGALRIESVPVGKNGEKLYNTVITASLIDLKSVVQDKYLTDLNFIDLKHRYDIETITRSWAISTERYNPSTFSFYTIPFQIGSGYVYPAIDYGHTGLTVNNINFKNYKPAVYVKEYMDRIFRQSELSGYTYEIKGSDEFKEMFSHLIVPDCQDVAKFSTTGVTSIYFKTVSTSHNVVFPASDIYATRTDRVLVPIDLILFPSPSVSASLLARSYSLNEVLEVQRTFTTTSSIDIQISEYYTLTFGSVFTGLSDCWLDVTLYKRPASGNANNNDPLNNSYPWYAIQTGSIKCSGNTGYDNHTYSTHTLTMQLPRLTFNYGEQYAIGIDIGDRNNGQTFYQDNYDIDNNYIDRTIFKEIGYSVDTMEFNVPASITDAVEFIIEPVSGNTNLITPVAPVNVKQIDFLKSIMNQFNFFVYSKMDNHKHLIFESYDDYYGLTLPQYLLANALDWTNKIDYSKGFNIKSNINLPKSYLFTYKEDSDWFNDLYKKKFNQVYGQFSFEDEWGLTSQKKLELIFSPTVLIGEAGTDRKYPALYKNESNVKKPMKTNIRVIYYNGLRNCFDYSISIYSGYSYVTQFTGSTYPYCGNYYLSGNTVINDIHFNQPKEVYFDYNADYAYAPNSYGNYYINQTGDLTNPDVVYMECQAMIDDIDISNLDLRVPIYINTGNFNGGYFKLIKLEFNGAEAPSKLTLQKIVY